MKVFSAVLPFLFTMFFVVVSTSANAEVPLGENGLDAAASSVTGDEEGNGSPTNTNLRGSDNGEGRKLGYNSWDCYYRNSNNQWQTTNCEDYKSLHTCNWSKTGAINAAKALCVAPTTFRVADGGPWHCRAKFQCGKF